MEVVQLPKSAEKLLPEHAIASFHKWAVIFAKWMDDSSFSKQLSLEAARKDVDNAVKKLERERERLSKDSTYAVTEQYKKRKYEIDSLRHSMYSSYLYNTYLPPTKEERYERKLREAHQRFSDLKREEEQESRAAEEVAKYMSWWDWFNSLDMDGMKAEIMRLEGAKTGKRVIERMLS